MELRATLETMRIPESRRPLTITNIRWMLRNLRIENGNHGHIDSVMARLIGIAKADPVAWAALSVHESIAAAAESGIVIEVRAPDGTRCEVLRSGA